MTSINTALSAVPFEQQEQSSPCFRSGFRYFSFKGATSTTAKTHHPSWESHFAFQRRLLLWLTKIKRYTFICSRWSNYFLFAMNVQHQGSDWLLDKNKIQVEMYMCQICITADPNAKPIRRHLNDLHLIGLHKQPVGKEKVHSRVRVVLPHPLLWAPHFWPSVHIFAVFLLHCAVMVSNRRVKAHIFKKQKHSCPWQKYNSCICDYHHRKHKWNMTWNLPETALGSQQDHWREFWMCFCSRDLNTYFLLQ